MCGAITSANSSRPPKKAAISAIASAIRRALSGRLRAGSSAKIDMPSDYFVPRYIVKRNSTGRLALASALQARVRRELALLSAVILARAGLAPATPGSRFLGAASVLLVLRLATRPRYSGGSAGGPWGSATASD